jgi:hypothetical protein
MGGKNKMYVHKEPTISSYTAFVPCKNPLVWSSYISISAMTPCEQNFKTNIHFRHVKFHKQTDGVVEPVLKIFVRGIVENDDA